MDEQKMLVQPPLTLDVLDRHNGFTAIIPHRKSKGSDTLWRPSKLLKQGTTGHLQRYDTKSFYQQNSNVTIALYKVKGYPYLVACWFDNATLKRIA